MAPLPVESTARLFVDYTTCSEQHTLMCRFGVGSSVGDAIALVDAFLIALDDFVLAATIDAARVADLGSTFTYPVSWTGAATFGAGVGTHYKTANYLDFVGRSIGGRRVRMAVFGAVFHADTVGTGDYRFNATDEARVAAALAVLEASSTEPVAIDGDAAVWQQYANCGVNAYWRNNIR